MAEAQAATPAKPKTPVNVVKMSDGREVEFAGKRKLIKEVVITDEGVKVRLDFVNGETRLFPVRDPYFYYAAGHGMLQKYGDETAGLDDVDDMVIAVDELDEHLAQAKTADDWNRKREGGGLGGTSVLQRALVELSGKAIDEVKAFLKDKTQQEKMAHV